MKSNRPWVLSVSAALFAVLLSASGSLAQSAPSITMHDQEVRNGEVIVEQVVAPEDAFVDIHREAEIPGNAGEAIGHAPVKAGVNNYVVVPLDVSKVTSTMYAVVHQDRGTPGVFESPNGPDVPYQVNNRPVQVAFKVGPPSASAASAAASQPSISIADQPIRNGSVIVGMVVAPEDAFVDIHREAEIPGNAGEAIGHAPVKAGVNNYVVVPLDVSKVTSTMYAVVHQDRGTPGVFESPNGPDVPYQVNNRPVQVAFKVQGDLSAATQQQAAPTTAARPAQPPLPAATATAAPANTPAPAPTPAPTAVPTAAPTVVPTAMPTAVPTAVPTAAAIVTPGATVATTPGPQTTATVSAQVAGASSSGPGGAATGTPAPQELPSTGSAGGNEVTVPLILLGGLLVLAGLMLSFRRVSP